MLSSVHTRASDPSSRRYLETIIENLRMWGQDQDRRRLEELSALYVGDPYALNRELRAWEESSVNNVPVPLRERRPMILSCEARKIIERALSLLFGRGRFPSFTVRDKERQVVTDATAGLGMAMQKLGYPQLWLSAGRHGLVQGSACAAFYVPYEGMLYRKPYEAKDCTPTFGFDNPDLAREHGIPFDDLVHLRIRRLYQTQDEKTNETQWWMWQRELTPTEVIEYHPVRAEADLATAAAQLRKDEARSFEHNLGFVTATWVRSFELDDSPWGGSVLDNLRSMLVEVDYQESQRARACHYHGDPMASPDSSVDLSAIDGSDIPKGATTISPIPMKLVEMTGGGQTQQRNMTEDLRRQAQEVSQVYVHDPRQTTGALSGVAMEQLNAPTVNLIDELRGPYGEGAARLAEKLSRACAAFGMYDLKWEEGYHVTLDWPPVFPPNQKDFQEAAQATALLVAAQVISRKTALQKLRDHVGVEDIDGELDRILDEQKQIAEGALDSALANMPGVGDDVVDKTAVNTDKPEDEDGADGEE